MRLFAEALEAQVGLGALRRPVATPSPASGRNVPIHSQTLYPSALSPAARNQPKPSALIFVAAEVTACCQVPGARLSPAAARKNANDRGVF